MFFLTGNSLLIYMYGLNNGSNANMLNKKQHTCNANQAYNLFSVPCLSPSDTYMYMYDAYMYYLHSFLQHVYSHCSSSGSCPRNLDQPVIHNLHVCVSIFINALDSWNVHKQVIFQCQAIYKHITSRPNYTIYIPTWALIAPT